MSVSIAGLVDQIEAALASGSSCGDWAAQPDERGALVEIIRRADKSSRAQVSWEATWCHYAAAVLAAGFRRDPDAGLRERVEAQRRAMPDTTAEVGRVAAPPFLYHWSPTRFHEEIAKHGLKPGVTPSHDARWTALHICYGRSPASALALTLLTETLDLWMIRTDGIAVSPANDGTEWRSTETVPAFYVATRHEPRRCSQCEVHADANPPDNPGVPHSPTCSRSTRGAVR